ncbi:hypothetical protein GQ44DRAFT_223766 [Phaeosphaeriaceae sp. PMI808]|nr:hypothetical protein GQ44DRAFT_223766 [Phaeosphaeriaceae sp. PMI808]
MAPKTRLPPSLTLSPQSPQSRPPSVSTTLRGTRKSSTLFRPSAILIAVLGVYVIFRSISIMLSANTDLSQYTSTIFIPFVYKFSSKHVPQVMCTIEGATIKMPVDSGSTGILIGAPILSNVDPTVGQPAHHFFTSSKILYVGRLVKLPIKFDGEASSYATAKVNVLVVDKSWWCPWYNPDKDGYKCPPGPHGEKAAERDTSRITYMGIGFGRNRPGDGMPIAVPSVNSFLNIDTINGMPVSYNSMRTGYIITTKGVHIGLTTNNAQGFTFQNLSPGSTHDQDPRDWAMAQMCFNINGEGKNCGAVLVDTGISQMYIRPDEGVTIPTVTIRNPNKNGHAKMVKRVKRGNKIAVAFPSFDSAAASYSFTIGDGSAIEPNFVVPARGSFPPFVNTGRNFLYGYSIAFDAIGGRFGFQPVHSNSSSVL